MANDGSSSGSSYDWKAYRYDPSLVAAIIFILCFAVTTFFHLYQLIRTQTWYFIPLCIGGFCELFLLLPLPLSKPSLFLA